MIHLSTILLLLTAHWIADFIFQAEEWALNKRKDEKALAAHVACYTFIFVAMTGHLFDNFMQVVEWTWVTFWLHFFTDYLTSKWVGKKFDDKHLGGPIPNFGAFTIIGLDQIIHYVCIFGMYAFITRVL